MAYTGLNKKLYWRPSTFFGCFIYTDTCL